MASEQTPQRLIPGYRKLADFIQPKKQHLPQTQEISIIPRMKLPTIDKATGKVVVPWIRTWSSKTALSSNPTGKGIPQTPMLLPHTPPPQETFSDIETMHLSTMTHPDTTWQTGEHINTFVHAKNKDRDTTKSQGQGMGKILTHIFRRRQA